MENPFSNWSALLMITPYITSSTNRYDGPRLGFYLSLVVVHTLLYDTFLRKL